MVLSIFSVCLCQHNSWRPLHRGRSVCSGLTDSSSITAALKARFNDVLYFLSHCPPFPLSHSVTCITFPLFFHLTCVSLLYHYFLTIISYFFSFCFLYSSFLPSPASPFPLTLYILSFVTCCSLSPHLSWCLWRTCLRPRCSPRSPPSSCCLPEPSSSSSSSSLTPNCRSLPGSPWSPGTVWVAQSSPSGKSSSERPHPTRSERWPGRRGPLPVLKRNRSETIMVFFEIHVMWSV